MKRGKLVVFEGTDCSGKSTQIDLFQKRIEEEGKTSTTLDFPNYKTPTGKIVRRYLDGEFGPANDVDPRIASILFAQDRYASKKYVQKALEEYDIVILDRYVESNMGHQGGKISDPNLRKEFYEWLHQLEYINFELVKPDIIIFLYMPYAVGQELMKNRERKSEFHPGAEKLDGHEGSPEHLINAENAYLQLAEIFNWHKIVCAPDGTMNTLRTPEEIATELWSQVRDTLEQPQEEDFITETSEANMSPEEFCLCPTPKEEISQEERKRILAILEKII